MTSDEPFEVTLAALRDVRGLISDAQARRLFEHARAVLPPGRIVEIGSFQGRSTIVLARGARDGVEVVAIDPHAGTDRGAREIRGYKEQAHRDYAIFRRNLERCGVDGVVRHLRLPSDAALSRLDGEFELVFIDGAHRYRPARADIAGYGTRVRAGGALVLHDAFSAVGVTLAQMRLLFFGIGFRYEGRTASLAEYRREDLHGAAWLVNIVRQLSQLPWFARNVALKAALVLKLRRVARLLGDRTGEWPG
jgi:predicted O-methyltransferase YrrM